MANRPGPIACVLLVAALSASAAQAQSPAGPTTKPASTQPAGPLVARVPATDRGSATLDKGTADGVQQRMRFVVERNSAVIAELVVLVEYEHSAYCVADGVREPMKVGDRAVAQSRPVRPPPTVTTQPDALIEGLVRAAKFGRVEVTAGAKAGVTRGTTFVIHRRSKPLGKGFVDTDADAEGRVYVCAVLIDQVHDDWSAGQVRAEWEDPTAGQFATGEKRPPAPPED